MFVCAEGLPFVVGLMIGAPYQPNEQSMYTDCSWFYCSQFVNFKLFLLIITFKTLIIIAEVQVFFLKQ